MKFLVRTYGCQMNVRDSESVSALLRKRGHTETTEEDLADLLIVNTCSVRGKAEDKALGKLGLLVKTKKTRPSRIVGVMGCMAQRLGEEVFKKVPGLDFSVGTQRLAALPGVIERFTEDGGPILEVGDDADSFEALSGHIEGAVSAFVNILFGCDRRCTYCIVPDVRGREWSRPGHKVVEEVRALADSGVKEVTLLGQSVTRYGLANSVWSDDECSGSSYSEPLPRLFEAISGVPGIERIRFTSSHPSGCTGELVRAMVEFPALCEHVHLPVQSGSDRILKRMGRGYSSDDYRRAVELLRTQVPSVALTTDVIVGFPSETEEEFEETRSFMEEIGFDNSFIFKYSSRPGTAAAKWQDDVPDAEKARRNQVLLADQDVRGLRINEGLVGSQQEVLAEGESVRNAARWAGRSRGNKIVVFERPEGVEEGDLVTVAVERAMAQTLYGRVMLTEREGNQ